MKSLATAGFQLSGAFLGRHGDQADQFFQSISVFEPGRIMKLLRSIGGRILGTPLSYGKYFYPEIHIDPPPNSIIYVDHLHMMVNIRAREDWNVWLDEHNIEFQLWDEYSGRTPIIMNKLVEFEAERVFQFEMNALQSVQGFGIPSKEQLSILPESLKEKGRIIPNGVDSRWLSDGLNRLGSDIRNLSRIGFIGKYDWQPNRRGVERFLQSAWAEIRERNTDASLILAGQSPPEHWPRYEGVNTTGYVKKSSDFFKQIDLLVVPLDIGSGTRIKVLESLARGIPVLGTEKAVEGLNFPYYPRSSTISGLVDLYDQFTSDLNKLGEIRDRAYHQVRSDYAWSEIGRKLADEIMDQFRS